MRIDHSVPTRLVRRARLRVVSAIATALLAVSAPAKGEPAPASRAALSDTVIVYEAPEGCPSQVEFEARVRSRMPARESTTSSLRRIEARLAKKGTRIAASVVLTDANGAVTTRRIAAASCNEAVDGLALIVALTVDPLEAHAGPVSPTPTSEPEGTAPPGSTDSNRRDQEHPAAGESKEAAPRPEQAAPVAPEPTTSVPAALAPEANESGAPSSPTRLQLGISASFLVASGTVPGWSPGGELGFVASAWKAPTVSVRAGGRLVAASSDTGAEGSVSLSWWSAFLAGCLGSDPSVVYVLSGCAVYELGQLGATGSKTQNARSSTTLWQALGPELRFEWAFAAPVALNAAVAGMFPLRAERFIVGGEVVYPVPALGIRAQIGAGVRF